MAGEPPPTMIAVIPGRLMWAPECVDTASCTATGTVVRAMNLISNTSGLYAVPHYPKQSYGRAFGPVALDKTIEFCSNLVKKLGEVAVDNDEDGLPRSKCIVLTTPPYDVQTRTNVVTMLGAYLVLRHGWSATKVKQILGSDDAERRFACAWARSYRPEGKRHHRVIDCWAGIELAKQLEWINPGVVAIESAKRAFCQQYHEWAHSYDAAWIVPGRIVVCADPQTTVNATPTTFKQIFPEGTLSRTNSCANSRGSPSGSASSVSSHSSSGLSQAAWRSGSSSIQSFDDTQSTDTVCKDFTTFSFTETAQDSGTDEPRDFVTFLKDAGVRVMIRCNFDDEPGMPPTGGYDPEGMRENGIVHSDHMVPDYDGGLPTKKGCRSAIDLVAPVLDANELPNAVAVHCKGGFGRSVVLACCVAIEKYDIPGDALMGWVRISRPGAITSPIQEQFLKKMTGRKVLRRWAGLPDVDPKSPGSDPQPKCGSCSVM